MRRLLLLLPLLAGCAGPRDAATGAAIYADGIANSAAVTDIRVGDSYVRLRIVPPQGVPKAVLILFSGGDGRVGIKVDGKVGSNNFLVRTRDQWAAHGLLVIIPDAPANRSTLFNQRLTNSYRDVIAAVVAHARTLSPAPIWLMGTSAGAPSALFGAAALPPGSVHGAVVSSAVAIPSGNDAETAFSVALDRIRVPVLLQYHREDGCFVTPPTTVPRIRAALVQAPTVELQGFSGGNSPQSSPCEAQAAHGFFGIESQVVDAASGWMLAH